MLDPDTPHRTNNFKTDLVVVPELIVSVYLSRVCPNICDLHIGRIGYYFLQRSKKLLSN